MNGKERPCQVAVAVPTAAWAPGAARSLVRRTIGEALRGTDERSAAAAVADAELAVSELVTNAIRHGGPPVRLRLKVQDRGPGAPRLRIEVQDGGSGSPRLHAVGAEAVSGRGLALVQAVSQEWGVRSAGTGKVVHATLRLGGATAGPAAA